MQTTPLADTVNKLIQHGYRTQLFLPDFAVLARQRPESSTIHIVLVHEDGSVNTQPLGEFIESILHG